MIALIQSLEAHVFTFKEVAGYVTLAVYMSFAVGFLIAAYTRIFADRKELTDRKRMRTIGMDQGAAWAIAYMARYESKQIAERMASEWGFKTLESLKEIDEYDSEMIIPFIKP